LHALTRTTFGPLKSLANDFTAPLAHLVLWAMLGFLVARALRLEGLGTRSTWWIGLAICVAYGIGTEAVQAAHPVRVGRAIDVGYDSAGALLGLWLSRRKRAAEPESDLVTSSTSSR
jgi:VanZ family protein